jgi:cell wall-associated protease
MLIIGLLVKSKNLGTHTLKKTAKHISTFQRGSEITLLGVLVMRSILLFLSVYLISASAGAANLAIVDSGVDYKHKDLAAKMWTNPETETKISVDTIYQDDTHGWNFADNNNQVIDYKYLGTFPADCNKMFDVQSRMLKGMASAADKTWYKSKKADADFQKQLQIFGNFVHGTHVSGIASKNADASQLIALKIIPTDQSDHRTKLLGIIKNAKRTHTSVDTTIRAYLDQAADDEGTQLQDVGNYVKAVHADVANGSFGTSADELKPAVAAALKQITGKDATDADITKYSTYLIQKIVISTQKFVKASPATLFVFAAGNDSANNDQIPNSPANVKTTNTISVAATQDVSAWATFSNFGPENVEVAAPGVAIISTIPGDQYLPLSGTSMAAPFVTNVAGVVKDANPALSPAEIKSILMGTVDVKSFLQDKVKTSGIVNRARAIAAATFSRTSDLDSAIAKSLEAVSDVPETHGFISNKDILVVKLPSFF